MNIRCFQEKDIDQMAEVCNEAGKNDILFRPITGKQLEGHLRHSIPGIQLKKDVIIAEEDDKAIGFVGIFTKIFKKSKLIPLFGPVIHPEYQRKEIGTQLMKIVLDKTKQYSGCRIETTIPQERKIDRHLLEKFNFVKTMWYHCMRLELSSKDASTYVVIPPSISIRQFQIGQDEQDFVDVSNRNLVQYDKDIKLTVEELKFRIKNKPPGSDTNGIFLVEEKDKKKIIGFCEVSIDWEEIKQTNDYCAYGMSMGIDQEYRSFQMAYALMFTVGEYLKDLGIKSVELVRLCQIRT